MAEARAEAGATVREEVETAVGAMEKGVEVKGQATVVDALGVSRVEAPGVARAGAGATASTPDGPLQLAGWRCGC